MDARSLECVDAVRAGDLLLGHDEWGARWIAELPREPGGGRVVSAAETAGCDAADGPRAAPLRAHGENGAA